MRAIAHLRLDALDDVDHAVERGLGERGHVAGLSKHRPFHQRIAGANGDAVSARNATRFANRRAAVPQDTRDARPPS